MNRRGRRFGAAIVIAAASVMGAQAVEIYRWVDENGKTQISDVVPPKYKSVAVRVDSKQFDLPADQQRDAEARAAAVQKAAASGAPTMPSNTAAGNAAAGNATAGNASPAPAASAPGRDTDCASLRKQYRESQECFAPFINANGSIRPSALAVCKQVDDPSIKCGLPSVDSRSDPN